MRPKRIMQHAICVYFRVHFAAVAAATGSGTRGWLAGWLAPLSAALVLSWKSINARPCILDNL